MQILSRIIRKILCSGLIEHPSVFPVGTNRGNTLYLTFDDGPNPLYTSSVLDLLRRNQIQATFFVNGDKLLRCPEIGSQIVQQGHLLGNHTHTHKVFTSISRDERRKEVSLGQNSVEKYQQGIKLFRPPQGLLYFSDMVWLIRNGHCIVMWSIDSHDAFHLPAADIVHRLKQRVKGDNVLLFHDDNQLCVEVLESLIPWWKSQGFSFCAIGREIV